MALPTPTDSDLRFSARVDYFETAQAAIEFAQAKRDEGFNVCGGSALNLAIKPNPGEIWPHNPRLEPTRFQGLYGVHWVDRQGEGWYG